MNHTEITHAILTGEQDEHIERIAFAVSERQKKLRVTHGLEMAGKLGLGDVVVIGAVRPQYLQGMTGQIVEKQGRKIHVKLDAGPTRKFRSGVVICNAAALKKLI